MADSLETDGFAVVDGLCDPALLRHLLTVAGERTVAVREALGDRQIGIGSRAGYDVNTHFESRRSIFESTRTAPDS